MSAYHADNRRQAAEGSEQLRARVRAQFELRAAEVGHGKAIHEVARNLGLDPRTVKRLLGAEEAPQPHRLGAVEAARVERTRRRYSTSITDERPEIG